jgi:hypothetical protein
MTVAARAMAWTVLVRSNARIVGSNATKGMNVYLYLFCVPVSSGLTTDLELRNWIEIERFTDALCSKVGATGKRADNKKNRRWKKRTILKSKKMFLHAVGLKCVIPTYCTNVRKKEEHILAFLTTDRWWRLYSLKFLPLCWRRYV